MARKAGRGNLHSGANGFFGRPSRRAVLSTMGMGAAGAAAGCIGDDSTGDDDGGGEEPGDDPVEGATLKLLEPANPENSTFFFTRLFPSALSTGSGWQIPNTLWYMIEPGFWGMWSNSATPGGEVFYGQYDDYSVEPDEINVSIRDDAVWSDGATVTGKDALTELVIFRLFDNITPIPDVIEDGPGPIPIEMATGFEYDDDGFTIVSHNDSFENMIEGDIRSYFLSRWAEFGGLSVPTHVEPYDDWSDVAWDHLEMQINEEWEHPMWGNEYGIREPLAAAINADSDQWPEHYRDPENVVVNGAWQLSEVRGTQGFTLEPNPEHRNVDEINFDRIELDWRAEDRANWAALEANSLHYFDEFMPQDVAEGLPGEFEVRTSPFDDGVLLGIDHSSPFFEDVRGRWAFMHIIDTEDLVAVENPNTHAPIVTPGADMWGINEFVDDDVLEQFHSYEQDWEEAARLLEEIGFTQEGGDWYLPNGDRAQLLLPITEETPRWQQSLIDQLNEFGIEADLQGFDTASYNEQRNGGDFTIWPEEGAGGVLRSGGGVGFPDWGLARAISHQVAQWGWWNNVVNIYPQEQIEETEYGGTDTLDYERGLIADTSTEPSGFGGFTLEVPPLGERDGTPEPVEAMAMGWEAHHPDSEEQLRELYPELAWICNWYLLGLPLMNKRSQIAVNTGNWTWPAADSEHWEPLGVEVLGEETLLSRGDLVTANSNNPVN